MPRLHFVTNSINTVREETIGGVTYLVAPVVAMREGVLGNREQPGDILFVGACAFRLVAMQAKQLQISGIVRAASRQWNDVINCVVSRNVSFASGVKGVVDAHPVLFQQQTFDIGIGERARGIADAFASTTRLCRDFLWVLYVIPSLLYSVYFWSLLPHQSLIPAFPHTQVILVPLAVTAIAFSLFFSVCAPVCEISLSYSFAVSTFVLAALLKFLGAIAPVSFSISTSNIISVVSAFLSLLGKKFSLVGGIVGALLGKKLFSHRLSALLVIGRLAIFTARSVSVRLALIPVEFGQRFAFSACDALFHLGDFFLWQQNTRPKTLVAEVAKPRSSALNGQEKIIFDYGYYCNLLRDLARVILAQLSKTRHLVEGAIS